MENDFGAKVRQFRLGLGLTQPEFALRLGLSKQSVGNIESSGKAVSMETLKKLRSLGADLNWLLDESPGDGQ